jgi:predicted Zn-dependent protease
MTDLAVTDALFFDRTGMDPARVEGLVNQSLASLDDGELYLEYSQSESLSLDDGRIKSASFDTSQGFGLRGVAGEAAGYAHASELSEEVIPVSLRRRLRAPTAAYTLNRTRSVWWISQRRLGFCQTSTRMPAAATRASSR